MSHTYADAAENPEVLEAFEGLVTSVQEAKDGGLSIDRILMMATDPAAYTLEDGWTQEEVDVYNEEYAAYVGTLTQLTAQAPPPPPPGGKHHYNENWRLSIKSDRTIECDPGGGGNKY
ncbi:hypothetical protein RRF57_004773 [Xylaria bambusicola]|uniref:Uncharacterized protein n=1 Tax=Xylaria bambusicola TaxID=326684 RepID=A0AAN7UKI4_9PEZI